jgi:light-regulated signal transduction histidine kinase (bacteriophytochrome)
MLNQNIPLLSPNVAVNLSNCDLEPIHIPSSIQPHGMLIAARQSDMRIVYTSENSLEVIGLAAGGVLNRTLTEILGVEAVVAIEEALGAEQYFPTNILTRTIQACGEKLFDMSAHRTGRLLCVELELALEPRHWDQLAVRLEKAIRELGQPNTLTELCAAIPPLIRQLTGYDRVMVYRFDRDGHGEVIGEDKAHGMEPFLGLHYPATDIPNQARKLYLLQRLRTIVDVGYQAARVFGHPSLAHGEPLDMTYCGLRSVSPVHIEYLRNMGVGASLGTSLIHSNKLWGMIICHHLTPRRIPPEVRALCDLLSQVISLLIGVTLQTHDYAERLAKKALLDLLNAVIEERLSVLSALVEDASVCLALTGAAGALLRIDGVTKLIGVTPSLPEAAAIMSAFRSRLVEGVFFTDQVGALFDEFNSLATTASGALMVQFGQSDDGILFFRGEMAQTVHWAGKPDSGKQLSEDGIRLSPRKSFAAWEEVQKGRSLPWKSNDSEAAVSLQRRVTNAILKRSNAKVAQLSEHSQELELKITERTQTLRQLLLEKETLLKEVHHRVKNNLQVVGSLLSLQIGIEGESPAAQSLRDAYGRIHSMSLVHKQIYESETLADLDFGAYIQHLSEQIFQSYCTDSSRIKMKIKTEPMLLMIDEAIPCGLILNELISNALKHAFRDGRNGLLEISFRNRENRYAELIVRDNGAGLPAGFQLESATSMGMEVVKALISQLGARLTISQEGGTQFVVSWHAPELQAFLSPA